ncbi:MAG: PIN domain-containing protein [Gammaproteobacteria bacterium]|nr:PIN domain-containing protein [Gammaproteobacteria bacterium]
MTRCVVDTNIVVYYLNQVGGDDFRRRFDQIIKKGAFISVITRIEVLSGLDMPMLPPQWPLPKPCYQPFARNP